MNYLIVASTQLDNEEQINALEEPSNLASVWPPPHPILVIKLAQCVQQKYQTTCFNFWLLYKQDLY